MAAQANTHAVLSGVDEASFNEFLREFSVIVALNRWQETDLSLLMGASLQGPALANYKIIYNYGISF